MNHAGTHGYSTRRPIIHLNYDGGGGGSPCVFARGFDFRVTCRYSEKFVKTIKTEE